jgi:hypothetical protein
LTTTPSRCSVRKGTLYGRRQRPIATTPPAGEERLQAVPQTIPLRNASREGTGSVAGYVEAMSGLSIDFGGVVAALDRPLDGRSVGRALLKALADHYQAEHSASALYEFEQSGASYLFDLASSADLPQEDRTVAAWAVTPGVVAPRDTGYQRGFPLATSEADPAVDRGHVIPHLSGGEFGPNIFRQDRALNRGWSEQGKRYRALEREAANAPGTLYIAHLIYADDSAYPSELETGLLRGTALHVERFDNRPTRR